VRGVIEDFLAWGRLVVNATATRLESEIPGAARKAESHLKGYEALYVHFRDAKMPQDLAVWLFAAREGTANNVRGFRDAIGVGIKHDADVELDQGAWSFRPLSPFTWKRHIDGRYEGYRWLRNADALPPDPDAAAAEVVEQVLRTLRRAEAVAY
jgi:hypothetical protein